MLRLIEFSSIKTGQEENGRALATLIWLLPLLMMICCLAENKRFDTAFFVAAIVLGLLFYFIRNCTIYSDHYYVVSPDRRPGESNGLFSWEHTNSSNEFIPFLPFLFYMALTIAIIYSIGTFASNYAFWILFGSIVIASIIGGITVFFLYDQFLSYFWSMMSLILIAVGTIAILMQPG